MLLEVGRELVPDFTIDEKNREAYNLLFYYMASHKNFETTEAQHALGRGLLLLGQIGTGKTDMMRILQRCFNRLQDSRRFAYVSMIELARQYSIQGPEVIDRYSRKNLYVDEFGLIDAANIRKFESVSYYGNRVDVGELLVLNRYDEYKNGILTHFSTNLSGKQIEELYDPRTFSRLFEMCNFIPVTGSDRRKTAKPKPPVIVPPVDTSKNTFLDLMPVILEKKPEVYHNIVESLDKIKAKMIIQSEADWRAKEGPKLTQESALQEFKELLPKLSLSALNDALKQAELKQNRELTQLIEAELVTRNKAA